MDHQEILEIAERITQFECAICKRESAIEDALKAVTAVVEEGITGFPRIVGAARDLINPENRYICLECQAVINESLSNSGNQRHNNDPRTMETGSG
jgi:hypothetical protein